MSQVHPSYDPVDESRMTLMDHLRELRTRLIWVIGALIAGTAVSMLFVSPLLQFIIMPLTEAGAQPMAIGPTDTISVFFKVSFTCGAVLAMPMIVYHIIAFMSPGLYPNEKRNLILILPGVMVLFSIGALFAYFMLLPTAVGFLQSFLGDIIAQEWTIDRYISFVTRIVRNAAGGSVLGACGHCQWPTASGFLAPRHRDYRHCRGRDYADGRSCEHDIGYAAVVGALLQQCGHCLRHLQAAGAA